MENLFYKIIDGKQFNFQPFGFGAQTGYHVDVKDEDGTRWEFSMMHVDVDDVSKMKIEGNRQLPSWLINLQATLIKAVNEKE